MFEELFKNPDFQPDLLKIYPCALLKEAPLYKLWKEGKYKPYAQSQLIELVKSIKKRVPYYIRIQRISRDIPSPSIISGPAKISNLRQILTKIIKKEGWRCKCIRCREVRKTYDPKERIYLFRKDYKASGGKEIFLSFENENRTKLYSLLRLRLTSRALAKGEEENLFSSPSENIAIIREIHTYGQQLSITDRFTKSIISPQHKGLGKKLIKKAEKIAKKDYNPPTTSSHLPKGKRAPFGLNKIAVISSIGARGYFRKLGYRLEDTYMIKRF
ncbi:MAG: hypothetical protein Q8M00_01890, partial [bacterium]|nr:hypothetical protein [bacterium]